MVQASLQFIYVQFDLLYQYYDPLNRNLLRDLQHGKRGRCKWNFSYQMLWVGRNNFLTLTELRLLVSMMLHLYKCYIARQILESKIKGMTFFCLFQPIKSYWNRFKLKLKVMKGCRRDSLQSYMNEFIWRYTLGTRKFPLKKFIQRISLLVSQSREITLDEFPGLFFHLNFRIW